MYTDSSSIKGDSTIITIHPATIYLPLKGKTQGIHESMQKTRVCMRITQEKPCVHVTVRKNSRTGRKRDKNEGK